MLTRAALMASLGLVFYLGISAVPAPAEAKGIPLILYSTGDQFYEVGDLPPELASEDYGKAAYLCQHFALFWADFARWDCNLVVYDGDNTYADIPAEMLPQMESQYPLGFLTGGLWRRAGAVVIGGVVIALIVMGIMGSRDD